MAELTAVTALGQNAPIMQRFIGRRNTKIIAKRSPRHFQIEYPLARELKRFLMLSIALENLRRLLPIMTCLCGGGSVGRRDGERFHNHCKKMLKEKKSETI